MIESISERQLLQDISGKLGTIIGYLAISGREQNAQITILRSLDFEWDEIGRLVGLTADAARMRFNSTKNGSATKKPKGLSINLVKGAE